MTSQDSDVLIAVAEQSWLYEPLARREGERVVLWPADFAQDESPEWED